MDVDRPLVSDPAGPPDGVEELAATEREADVGGEVGQEVELAGGQHDGPPRHVHLTPGGVDGDGSHLEHRRVGGVATGSGAAQDSPDSSDQLARREGLGDVVVGTELETQHTVDLVVACAEHEDRHGWSAVPAGADQAAADVEAVELARQADVEHHDDRAFPFDEREPGAPVGSLEDPEPVPLEVEPDQVGDVGVVLDDDDRPRRRAHARAWHGSPWSSGHWRTREHPVVVPSSRIRAMPAYLETILDAHRRQAAEDRRDRDELVDAALRATAAQRPGRGFEAALAQGAARDGVAVIAEVKRRSPSRGNLAPDLDPAAAARAYAAGGAACLSVLTDQAFFGAQPGDLPSARGATDLPVLRKDFTVSEADVCDARLLGADAVLLIVAALSDEELAACSELARRLDLDALVEVHSAVELSRAQAVGATLIGVNQRDLATFAVDRRLAASLADRMGDDVVAVAESGIRGADDVAELVAAGYHGVLVGESLVVAGDRSGAVASLVAAGHRQRTATSEHR